MLFRSQQFESPSLFKVAKAANFLNIPITECNLFVEEIKNVLLTTKTFKEDYQSVKTFTLYVLSIMTRQEATKFKELFTFHFDTNLIENKNVLHEIESVIYLKFEEWAVKHLLVVKYILSCKHVSAEIFLEHAVKQACFETVQFLICQLTITDYTCYINIAIGIGNMDILNLLLEKGTPSDGSLDIASERGHVEIVQLDRKSTRLNSSHIQKSRMPSSA